MIVLCGGVEGACRHINFAPRPPRPAGRRRRPPPRRDEGNPSRPPPRPGGRAARGGGGPALPAQRAAALLLLLLRPEISIFRLPVLARADDQTETLSLSHTLLTAPAADVGILSSTVQNYE